MYHKSHPMISITHKINDHWACTARAPNLAWLSEAFQSFYRSPSSSGWCNINSGLPVDSRSTNLRCLKVVITQMTDETYQWSLRTHTLLKYPMLGFSWYTTQKHWILPLLALDRGLWAIISCSRGRCPGQGHWSCIVIHGFPPKSPGSVCIGPSRRRNVLCWFCQKALQYER